MNKGVAVVEIVLYWFYSEGIQSMPSELNKRNTIKKSHDKSLLETDIKNDFDAI